MEITEYRARINGAGRSVLLDFLALAFIYYIPALSHLFALPVYYIEPMRFVLILAMAHTNKSNALLLALTLPVFSFITASHPVLLKAGLIAAELGINLGLFYWLSRKFVSAFLPAVLSIIAAKAVYYALKYAFVSAGTLEGPLVATPLTAQLIMTAGYSLYIYFVFRSKKQ